MKLILLLTIFLSFSAYAEKKSITQIRQESIQFFADNPKEALKDYDQQELDLLYIDLENLTILQMMSKYPELTPKELEELKTKRK